VAAAREVKARFTGVSKKRPDGMFLVTMRVLGKMHKLGTWLREVDAAVAFDRASLWFGRDGALTLHTSMHTARWGS